MVFVVSVVQIKKRLQEFQSRRREGQTLEVVTESKRTIMMKASVVPDIQRYGIVKLRGRSYEENTIFRIAGSFYWRPLRQVEIKSRS